MKGVGPRTIHRAFAADEQAEDADPSCTLAKFAADRTEIERKNAFEIAMRICEQSEREGIEILSLRSPRYPQPLAEISDPPPFLYLRGELPGDWVNAVAVIGTREPSPETICATEKVVDSLAHRRSTIVVSGLALGIDTVAHVAALKRSLRTVAVLANGLDSVYPKANAELAQRIIDAGGCVLSETSTGRGVSRFNLVARDRIQSGLSRATFLMQSSLDGGSMHTAFYTLEQKRTLIALKPPDVETREWQGNAFLLGMFNASSKAGRISQFYQFPSPFAFGMSADLIEPFVERGLDRGFIPRLEREPALALSL
jgi:DNA processing protein